MSMGNTNPARFIVFIAFVGGLTLAFSLNQTPTYEATVKILVSQKNPGNCFREVCLLLTNGSGNFQGLQEIASTAAKVVRNESVARATVEQLNLPELSAQEVLANTNVEPDPGTMFVDISYKDSDPQRAQLLANTIAEVGSQKISNVTPGAYPLSARVWEPATLPKAPISPKPILNTLTALVLGLTICVGWAFARHSGASIAASVSEAGQTNRAAMGRVEGFESFKPWPATEEGAKEQELLEALGRSSLGCGELTAAGAALETSLTVEEADRMLSLLAAKGHLRVRVSETGGGIFYSFWQR
jgi:capsular polysaccharide biosynthesis protein